MKDDAKSQREKIRQDLRKGQPSGGGWRTKWPASARNRSWPSGRPACARRARLDGRAANVARRARSVRGQSAGGSRGGLEVRAVFGYAILRRRYRRAAWKALAGPAEQRASRAGRPGAARKTARDSRPLTSPTPKDAASARPRKLRSWNKRLRA